MKAIYSSAYYRGLEALLQMWPKIKERAPDATLDIYYGWESWVTVKGKDDLYYRITKLLEDLKGQGVTEHGRVSHAELAKAMEESDVWLYPTEFEEINCITALKQNAAGNHIVITDVAALKETGGPFAKFIETDVIYSDEYNKKKFIDAAVEALTKPNENKEAQKEWSKQFHWDQIAKQWSEAIENVK